jgi:HEAT repeat protein
MDPIAYVKLLSSRSPWRRLEALESNATVDLRMLGARACITDSHPEVRRAAADIIKDLGSQSDYVRLTAATTDKSWKVRSSAADALGELAIKRSKDRVAEMLRNDRHFVVRRDAALALAASDWHVLHGRLSTEKNDIVRVAIYLSLYALGDKSALKESMRFWRNANFLVRSNAINLIAFVKIDESDKETLKQALDGLISTEENQGVRGDAISLRNSL